jgi:hypothetical protein
MGKTLKKQRKREAAHATIELVQPQRPIDANKSIVKINVAFGRKRWDKIISELQLMLHAGKQPKLGTLQRWVRFADTTGNSELTARIFYWILRVVGWTYWQDVDNCDSTLSGPVRHWPAWDCNDGLQTISDDMHHDIADTTFTAPKYAELHYAVPVVQESGSSSTQVRAYPPNTLQFQSKKLAVDRVNVPFVPGAFVLRHVFTPHECRQLMDAAIAMGFSGDVDYTFGYEVESSARLESRPAEGCFWMMDDSILEPVMDRIRTLLPATIDGRPLAGIHARWRFYRYNVGTIYRPHIDGSWPGSGVTADGTYVFDVFGDRWSCLTFLIYLNDDFEDGTTTFYVPSVDARGVKPCAGHVLCFPHGSLDAALHEGSAVTRGCKYVMRSDVLYMKEAVGDAKNEHR